MNVLLALVVRHHEHHETALHWFDRRDRGEIVLCRFVQVALMRLLANRTIMAAHAPSAASAWLLIEQLLADERLEFVHEPPTLDSVLPSLLRHREPTGKLVGDAYLAAPAIAGSMRVSTFDAGFEQFRGLDVELIRHDPNKLQ